MAGCGCPATAATALYGPGWYPYATVWNVPKGYAPPPRPHGTPIRRIGLGPVGPHPVPPAPRLVTVNRGEEFSKPFQGVHPARPEPRSLSFEGKHIAPLEPGIHPIQRGPVGESFTNALMRTHPELGPVGMRGVGSPVGVRGGVSPGFRPGFMPTPGRTFGAPASFGSVPVGRGGYSPGIVNRGNFGGGAFHGGGAAPGISGGGGFHGGGGGGAPSFGGGHAGAAPAASAAPAGGGGGAHH